MTPPPLIFPAMGCGTWAWGNRLLWNYDPSQDAELHQVFNCCLRGGVTLFDTGDSYGTGKFNGRSETLLGQFAQASPPENRDTLCLATKLAPYPWRLTRPAMLAAAAASEQRLGRIDLVQLHWSTANYFPWQEGPLLEGLMDWYAAGRARGLGLSNYGPRRLRWAHQRFAARGLAIASLQVQCSLLSPQPLTDWGLQEVCDELGIRLIAYSPLALGLLTGKYSVEQRPGGLRGWLCRQILPGARSLLGCLEAIAHRRERTMAQVALNWCMAKGTIPIPGARTLAQAQENLGALGWQLDSGEVAALDQEAARVKRRMVQNSFQSR